MRGPFGGHVLFVFHIYLDHRSTSSTRRRTCQNEFMFPTEDWWSNKPLVRTLDCLAKFDEMAVRDLVPLLAVHLGLAPQLILHHVGEWA